MVMVEEGRIPYIAFWSSCLALLSLGAICVTVCIVTIWQHRSRLHPINQAAALMFVADISMILNFLPREIKMVYDRALETSAWCTVSAVWTISSCVALSFAAACIAYVTWQTVENRTVPFRTMVIWNVTGWMTGLAIASSFGLAGLLGPFRGIYCCTKSNAVPEVAIPVLVVFAGSVVALVLFYHRAVQAAGRAQQVFGASHPRTSSPPKHTRTADMKTAVVLPLPRRSVDAGSQLVSGTSAAPPAHGRQEVVINSLLTPPVKAGDTSVIEHSAVTMLSPPPPPRLVINPADALGVPMVAAPGVDKAFGSVPTRLLSPRSAVSSVTTGARDAVSPQNLRGAATRSGGTDLQDVIARRARLLVFVFYACWSLTSLNAFAALCGADVPIESDMVGAFFLKLQPVLDSVLLIMSVRRGAVQQRTREQR